MSTALIDHAGCRVTLCSEHLVITPNAGVEGECRPAVNVPLAELDRVIIREDAAVTTPALGAMLKAGVAVHIMDACGRPLGTFTPPAKSEAFWRLRQFELAGDQDFRLRMARALVGAKIGNQIRLLQRLAANRHGEAPSEIAGIQAQMDMAERAGSIETLRGMEGAAAAQYFSAWAGFLPEEFPFERRSTRPPLNAVNAVLSFLSAMVYNELVGNLHAHGLEPGIGLLHATENGRWSLALDLMEPFRPAVAEALTIRLFSHRMLGAGDFENRDGGVYLNRTGRAAVVQQFEQRMERVFLVEQLGHRTTMRQVLREAVLGLKRALVEPETYKPFRMN